MHLRKHRPTVLELVKNATLDNQMEVLYQLESIIDTDTNLNELDQESHYTCIHYAVEKNLQEIALTLMRKGCTLLPRPNKNGYPHLVSRLSDDARSVLYASLWIPFVALLAQPNVKSLELGMVVCVFLCLQALHMFVFFHKLYFVVAEPQRVPSQKVTKKKDQQQLKN